MRWTFWRKPKSVQPGTPNTLAPVDWRVGDMAECVVELFDTRTGLHSGIYVGDRRMVKRVFSGVIYTTGERAWGLEFIGELNTYQAIAFRKIVLTDTGADRKVGKRVPVGEPA